MTCESVMASGAFVCALSAGSAAFAGPVSVFSTASPGGTGNSYELILDSSANADAARDAATASGGHLVTITTPAEQSFVQQLLDDNDAPTGSYWFGLHRVVDGNGLGTNAFGWDTGEDYDYQNFADGEPNDFLSGEDFGQIYWTSDASQDVNDRRGEWNDALISGYTNTPVADLNRRGFLIERTGVGGNPDDGGGDGDGGGSGGGGDGGGNGGGPAAIPLPPAVLAAPVAMLVGCVATRARRRRLA